MWNQDRGQSMGDMMLWQGWIYWGDILSFSPFWSDSVIFFPQVTLTFQAKSHIAWGTSLSLSNHGEWGCREEGRSDMWLVLGSLELGAVSRMCKRQVSSDCGKPLWTRCHLQSSRCLNINWERLDCAAVMEIRDWANSGAGIWAQLAPQGDSPPKGNQGFCHLLVLHLQPWIEDGWSLEPHMSSFPAAAVSFLTDTLRFNEYAVTFSHLHCTVAWFSVCLH